MCHSLYLVGGLVRFFDRWQRQKKTAGQFLDVCLMGVKVAAGRSARPSADD
jgi:hypothetical protein